MHNLNRIAKKLRNKLPCRVRPMLHTLLSNVWPVVHAVHNGPLWTLGGKIAPNLTNKYVEEAASDIAMHVQLGVPLPHVHATAAYGRKSPLHRLRMTHSSASKVVRRQALMACLSFLILPSWALAQSILQEERQESTSDEANLSNVPWAGPSVLPQPERLIAIGDLHGDLDATRRVLRLAGVLHSEKDEWIGGKTVVVQIGDQLDRGDDEIDVLALLYKLRKQAQAAGGGVHVLLGNHETMTAEDQMVYGSRGEWHSARSFVISC
jgi:hypothetical protein